MKEEYEEQLRLAEEVSDEFCFVPLVCPQRGAHARRGEASVLRISRDACIPFAETSCGKETKKKRTITLSDWKLSLKRYLYETQNSKNNS